MREGGVTRRPRTGASRGELWLPFLHRLAEHAPRAVVWKNAAAALDGHGDLDVIAPLEEWVEIEREFRRWAREHGLEPVAVCRHVPGSIFMLAADPERPAFFELDVKARGSYRGTTIFRTEDLTPLTELDERGFQRLRPGAEGLLKLIINGTADDGNLDPRRVQRERIVELLRADPDGAEQAARLFGRAALLVLSLVNGFLEGTWSRSRMLLLRARLRFRLLLEPAVLTQRLRARTVLPGECPGIKSLIKQGHLVPGGEARLRRLVQDHPPPDGAPQP